MSARSVPPAVVTLCAALTLLSCSDSSVGPQAGSTALLSVTPVVGAGGVERSPTIEVRFDGPVEFGATMLIALQVGDCPGPVVAGFWSRNTDGTVLSFTPMAPLDPETRYTIHIGGGMAATDGTLVDFEAHGPGMGGSWVTQDMVMGMNEMTMPMGMGMVSHSGPGWQSPNGFYGLAFSFTTGT